MKTKGKVNILGRASKCFLGLVQKNCHNADIIYEKQAVGVNYEFDWHVWLPVSFNVLIICPDS